MTGMFSEQNWAEQNSLHSDNKGPVVRFLPPSRLLRRASPFPLGASVRHR